MPTLSYYLRRPTLPASEKPALFTMNILPPMMTVWYHCARKYLKDEVDITMFDCSGTLDPRDFPGVTVQKFLNVYAATKSDEFLRSIARNRRIGWICDDDVFFVGGDAVNLLRKEFAVLNTATVSFRPRNWWHFSIENNTHPVSGSYCLAVNRDLFVGKEHLSFAPRGGNTHPSTTGKRVHRYDTADFANEQLLRKGYRCAVIDEGEANRCITAFSGLSGAVMLLSYFRTPEQTMEYFTAPRDEQWGGSLLFGVLSAMLAVCTIQECYERLTGRRYPLPSLPSRSDLERLSERVTPLLLDGRSFGWVHDVDARLKAAL